MSGDAQSFFGSPWRPIDMRIESGRTLRDVYFHHAVDENKHFINENKRIDIEWPRHSMRNDRGV